MSRGGYSTSVEEIDGTYWLYSQYGDEGTALDVTELDDYDEWGLDQYPLERLQFGSVETDEIDAKFNTLRSSWPKGQVTGTSMAAVLQPLAGVAKKIAEKKVGDKIKAVKGISDTIKDADKKAADRILFELKRLPEYGSKVIDAANMNAIKAAYYQVALTGTYLEGIGWFKKLYSETVEINRNVKVAVVESVKELPKTVSTAVSTAITATSKFAWNAIPWWVKLLGGGLLVGVGFLGYKFVSSGMAREVATSHVRARLMPKGMAGCNFPGCESYGR